MNSANQLVVDLIEFFKSGKIGASIANASQSVDKRTLHVIAINLLPWIKRALRPKHEALQLNQEYPWSVDLLKLINEDSFFRTLLVVEEAGAALNPNLTKEEIAKIQGLCAAAYNPPLMP